MSNQFIGKPNSFANLW